GATNCRGEKPWRRRGRAWPSVPRRSGLDCDEVFGQRPRAPLRDGERSGDGHHASFEQRANYRPPAKRGVSVSKTGAEKQAGLCSGGGRGRSARARNSRQYVAGGSSDKCTTSSPCRRRRRKSTATARSTKAQGGRRRKATRRRRKTPR